MSLVTARITPTSERARERPSRSLDSIGARYIRFGRFEVDQRKEVITKAGVRIRLFGKKYRILVMLLEKAGEVVSRDAMYGDLWPSDIAVNKNANLTTMINTLR